MLRFLRIQHLAVIDRLELELDPGLTVLTGETGAGKSILVGAVGLLVGGRASADLVRTGEDQAVIEAIFECPSGREMIVRREISAQGRSRAFIDGALVTSGALRDACGALVDLHGQHEHQLLLDPAAHLALLDVFGGCAELAAETSRTFGAWQKLRTDRDRLHTSEREKASRAEFIRFQLAEIDRVGPRAGEDEDLATTRSVLANADKLQRLCADAYTALYEGDDAAISTLGVVWRKVGDLAALDQRFGPYFEIRDTVKSQLEDLAFFLRSYASDIDASPARLQEIEDRLAALERLKKKHGPTLADVIANAARLRQDLDDIEHSTERAAQIEVELAAARDDYRRAASALSTARRASAPTFARKLENALADLAMGRTRCEVRFTDAADEALWSERGFEGGEFFISPNPGEDLRPLARIASGGELSRIMLALKTLATTDAPGKTLIFDEVDAGIGGAVADVVGRRLQELADRFQVLCITHLPQIAAHGRSHFRITKTVRRDRTITEVNALSGADREQEIARMIGGAEISATVIAGAREMLESRSQPAPPAVGPRNAQPAALERAGSDIPPTKMGESKEKAKAKHR
jgi:DNA repair protein RecN (Recombination protein N)